MKKILVFSAHPYDDILGCGGSLLKFIKNGYEIRQVYFSFGEYTDKNDIIKYLDEMRLKLNSEYKIYDIANEKITPSSVNEIIKIIENEILCFKPNIVFTNNSNDVNIEHKVVFSASMVGLRPLIRNLDKILAFDLYSISEWTPPFVEFSDNANVYINISDYMDEKINLCKIFKNEMRESPHPRSIEAIVNSAKIKGTQVAMNSVESFKLIREEIIDI